MSAGVTTCGTPMSSNNWRRRGEAEASRSTGSCCLFAHRPLEFIASLFAMIRVILQHRVRAIQLFGQHHAHHGVREGQRRQGPAPARRFRTLGAEPSGPPITNERLRPSCIRSPSHLASSSVVRVLPCSSSATR